MKLFKPSWVHHGGSPIYSIDVHQEHSIFATGGQNLDSGLIVIWNLLPVLCEKAENDPDVPKMLCQLDLHMGCVNCVRWSPNGEMLASGSDDHVIMIWRKSQGTSITFSSGGATKNIESWKCIHTLRNHTGDVLDLSWSPFDRYLATCSVDNTIAVWDAGKFPNIISVLKGHTSLVKGVSWDPQGKYLASQSDDRSIKIWKTTNWSCIHTITEPFMRCGGTTHSLRLSWSPDGQYLISAHALNCGAPTAKIIERDNWSSDRDFVGHRKAVTSVRFHSSLFQTKPKGPKESTTTSQISFCLAIGSRDCSLSIWETVLQRPLVVIHDIFKNSVTDLSWGLKETILLACSGDGTVACLQFTDNELGTPLSNDAVAKHIKRLYGEAALWKNCEFDYYPEDSTHKIEAPVLFDLHSGEVNNLKASEKQSQTNMEHEKRCQADTTTLLGSDADKLDARLDMIPDSAENDPLEDGVLKFGRANYTRPKCLCDDMYQASTATLEFNTASKAKLTLMKTACNYRVCVENNYMLLEGGRDLARVICIDLKSNKILWETFNETPIVNFNFCSKYLMLCTLSGSLRLIDIETEALVWPIITIGMKAAHIAFSPDGELVGVVTKGGLFKLWNIKKCKIIVAVDYTKKIANCDSVQYFTITSAGIPIIGFSDGNIYAHSKNLQSWLLVNSNSDPVINQALISVLPHELKYNYSKYPLLTAQATSFIYPERKYKVKKSDDGWRTKTKIDFIENQISLCLELKSPLELKYWYCMLVYHLAVSGTEQRLRYVFDNLLDEAGNAKLLSISKYELMACALETLKPHKQWSQIYTEYIELSQFCQNVEQLDSSDTEGQQQVGSNVSIIM